MSYAGLRLLLNYSMPLVLAGLAQMCVLLVGDVDRGIGSFIALVNCSAALWLGSAPVVALLACVGAYAGMGALVYLRALPSISAARAGFDAAAMSYMFFLMLCAWK